MISVTKISTGQQYGLLREVIETPTFQTVKLK